ncbi:MAG: chloride channel protein [Niabella sp.]
MSVEDRLLSGVLSVYFTLLVIHIKDFFGNITNNFLRVNLGALIVGTAIFFLPVLYGDSYHGIKALISQTADHQPLSLGLLIALSILKPLAASLTLGAGGDGGVFAPSIVSGAVLGLFVATLCNQYLGTHLILINFALVGAAATLSSSIYAPLTSLFLVCSLVPNGFVLSIPILIAGLISKKCSNLILLYNVYTYKLDPPVRN